MIWATGRQDVAPFPKDHPINFAERLIFVPANSLEMGHFFLAV